MKFKALKAAFPHTIPILMGYLFLGMAFGILLTTSGFPIYYATVMSILIYGGSMQFVAVEVLLSAFAPIQTFIMALLLQARHVFYGLSMLDKYKGLGFKKYYMIFAMTDETFSINCSVDVPEGIDKGWFMFFVSLLDHFYWIGGSTIGGLIGSMLTFNTDGISFVMTAMFVVIFLNQWLKEKHHVASILGLAASALCLVIFGADNFLVPSMIVIMVFLATCRKAIEEKGDIKPKKISKEEESK